jgi:hypothetical protein
MRPVRLSALMLVALLVTEGVIVSKDSSAQLHATCPDEVSWKGMYVNHSYGFSIFIPNGLAGLWNSARCVSHNNECTCMSDHGRIIPLSKGTGGPDRQIEAYADYGAELEIGTATEAATSELTAIRESSMAGTMTVLSRTPMKLGGLHAWHVVVRYSDKKSKNWMVEDFIDAVNRGVRYLLYLRTPEQEYAHDRITFNRIVGSFAVVHEDQDR